MGLLSPSILSFFSFNKSNFQGFPTIHFLGRILESTILEAIKTLPRPPRCFTCLHNRKAKINSLVVALADQIQLSLYSLDEDSAFPLGTPSLRPTLRMHGNCVVNIHLPDLIPP